MKMILSKDLLIYLENILGSKKIFFLVNPQKNMICKDEVIGFMTMNYFSVDIILYS